jgi:hypothetical protein
MGSDALRSIGLFIFRAGALFFMRIDQKIAIDLQNLIERAEAHAAMGYYFDHQVYISRVLFEIRLVLFHFSLDSHKFFFAREPDFI